MLSDEWLPRYRLLENFTAKWNGNGNGNAYDRGDYNSSFALCAVELKMEAGINSTFLNKLQQSIKLIGTHTLYDYITDIGFTFNKYITQTCLCNILQFFTAAKMKIFT